jgi:formylglycine-generating enzyme
MKTKQLQKCAALISLLFLICKTPQNPTTDPDNVQMTISYAEPTNGLYYVGDTIQLSVRLLLPNLVDSVIVKKNLTTDTVIRKPATDTIKTEFVLDSAGVNTIRIKAYVIEGQQRDTTFFITVQPQTLPDTTKPKIRLLRPDRDSTVISSNYMKIETIIKDPAGIARVRYSIGTDTFPVTKFDDTAFYAIITGLERGKYTQIAITAWDSSVNKNQSSFTLDLKYDTTQNVDTSLVLISPLDNSTKVDPQHDTLKYAMNPPVKDEIYYSVYIDTNRTNLFKSPPKKDSTGEVFSLNSINEIKFRTLYYWGVISHYTIDGRKKADTSALYSFYTMNKPPVWNLAKTGDTSYYQMQWDLNYYCKTTNNVLPIYKVAGKNCTTNSNALFFTADSQEILLTAIDTFSIQPCTTQIIFHSYSFKNKRMKYIPTTRFFMGGDYSFKNATPVHTVTVSSFFLDSVPVTQADYMNVMHTSNPSISIGMSMPVNNINWYDAVLYCNNRSKRDKLDTVYTYTKIGSYKLDYLTFRTLEGLKCDTSMNGYRLPTEAEWECAYRGGTSSPYFWGEDTGIAAVYSQINLADCPDYCASTDVGKKQANQYGLYDMVSNVREWCSDFYAGYTALQQVNPFVQDTTLQKRCVRGVYGGFDFEYSKSCNRDSFDHRVSSPEIGFRVCLRKRY